MYLIDVSGARAVIRQTDVLTVGMVGAKVEFKFDDTWNGLAKTAVFTQYDVVKDVVNIDAEVVIPHEVLQFAGIPVAIGVYGIKEDGSVKIPTTWAVTQPVKAGADPSGDESVAPNLDLWEQMSAKIGDISGLTSDDKTSLVAAINEAINTANSVRADADNGVFNGKPGTDGVSFEIFSTTDELKSYPIKTTATAVRFIWAGGDDTEYSYNITVPLKKYGVYDGKLGTYASQRVFTEITEVIVLSGDGSIDEESVKKIVDDYLAENPIEGGMTDEQAEQLNKNTNAISELQNNKADRSEIPATLPASDVYDWAKQENKPEYTAEEVGARPDTWTPTAEEVGAVREGTVGNKISVHNISENSHNDIRADIVNKISDHNVGGEAHSDIRLRITELSNRLSAVLDSENVDLDQLSEIVAYIKANKALIDSITTSKVSVSDIVNNLSTNVANKPLSAAQGVALKALIDALQSDKLDASKLTEAINTALAQAKASGEFDGKDGYTPIKGTDYFTESDKVEIAQETSKLINVPTKTSQLTNDSGYITSLPIVQGTGDSETDVMSQKAVSDTVFVKTEQALFTNIFDTVGIEYGKLLTTSGEVSDTENNLATTGFIQVNTGDVIRMENFALKATGSSRICLYDGDKNFITHLNCSAISPGESYYFKDPVLDTEGNLIGCRVDHQSNGFIRICTNTDCIGVEPILTIDEEINFEMGYGSKLNPNIKVEYSQVINSPQKNCWSILPNEHLNIAYSEIRNDGKPIKPINTLAHFENVCINYSYNMLKCDVQPTSDGELVLCHDAGLTADSNKVLTTYDANNCVKINTLTSAQCLEYKHSTGEPMCLLGDFLKLCRKYGKVAFITVREVAQMPVVIPKLLSELKKYNMTQSTIVNSLQLPSLQLWRKEYDDSVMLNYTLAKDAAIDVDAIDEVIALGYCSLGGFGMNGSTPTNTCNFDYARKNGVRLINAIAYYDGGAEACYELGYDGCQIAYPWMPVEDVSEMINTAIGDAIGGSY